MVHPVQSLLVVSYQPYCVYPSYLGVPNALAASSSVGDVECEFRVQPEMSVADLVSRRIRPFLIILPCWSLLLVTPWH